MIDMIKKEEENTNKARLIKKTHKGEVDVDGDEDLSTLEVSILSQIQSVVFLSSESSTFLCFNFACGFSGN
jgi:uncharacterized protein (UPF0218 family)